MHGWLALHHAAHEGHATTAALLAKEMTLECLQQKNLLEQTPLNLADTWAADGTGAGGADASKRYSGVGGPTALAIQNAIDAKSKSAGEKRKAEDDGGGEAAKK